MALEGSICHVSSYADCSSFNIEDQTGVYNVDTNPGGYGIPNPERSEVALYLVGYKYKEGEDDEDITSSLNNTDPANVISWDIPDAQTGYYYFELMIVDVWNNLTTYAVDHLVFHNQLWWKALAINNNSEPSSVNANWEEVTDMKVELGNASLVDQVHYDMNFSCRLEACYAKVVTDSGAICDTCQDCMGQALQLYMKLDVLLQSMFINQSQENWIEADKIARTMTGYCSKVDCRVC